MLYCDLDFVFWLSILVHLVCVYWVVQVHPMKALILANKIKRFCIFPISKQLILMNAEIRRCQKGNFSSQGVQGLGWVSLFRFNIVAVNIKASGVNLL